MAKNYTQPYRTMTAFGGQEVQHNGSGKRKGWEGKVVAVANGGDVHIDWVRGDGVEFARTTRQLYSKDWAEKYLKTPEDKTDCKKKDQYIVWCPTSHLPPRKVLSSSGADEAISDMAKKYPGQVFYKAKLERKAQVQNLIIEDL